jgi:hypothetical protein
MLLKEFIYFDRNHSEPVENNRYLNQNDTSVLKNSDLRKTRLTLKDINTIRLAGEAHQKEEREELSLIRKMYAAPPAEPGVGPGL